MRRIATKIKPKKGFAHVLHVGLLLLLPILLFVFVRLEFYQISLALILLSKWRMLAVRPRHWPANIRANAVDIIVGVSVLSFMMHSHTQLWQAIWALLYGFWLVGLKPTSTPKMISLQAMVGQLVGLMAIYLTWGDLPIPALVAATWAVCYVSARHFFTAYDEPLTRLMSYTWGYFAAALAWLGAHWLLFYGVIAQITLLLTLIGYCLATLYYLDERERLTTLVRRQFIIAISAIIIVIIVFSDWGDKAI